MNLLKIFKDDEKNKIETSFEELSGIKLELKGIKEEISVLKEKNSEMSITLNKLMKMQEEKFLSVFNVYGHEVYHFEQKILDKKLIEHFYFSCKGNPMFNIKIMNIFKYEDGEKQTDIRVEYVIYKAQRIITIKTWFNNVNYNFCKFILDKFHNRNLNLQILCEDDLRDFIYTEYNKVLKKGVIKV